MKRGGHPGGGRISAVLGVDQGVQDHTGCSSVREDHDRFPNILKTSVTCVSTEAFPMTLFEEAGCCVGTRSPQIALQRGSVGPEQGDQEERQGQAASGRGGAGPLGALGHLLGFHTQRPRQCLY